MKIGLIIIGTILVIFSVYLFFNRGYMGLPYGFVTVSAVLGVIGFVCVIVGAVSGKK